jgi:hypothetical protein
VGVIVSGCASNARNGDEQIYDEKQVLEAKLDLLMKTNLVDFAKEIIQGMAGTASACKHVPMTLFPSSPRSDSSLTFFVPADKERYDAMLKELAEKRPRVIATFGKLNKQDAAPILRVLDDQALLETLRQNRTFTMAHLEQHENVRLGDVLCCFFCYLSSVAADDAKGLADASSPCR